MTLGQAWSQAHDAGEGDLSTETLPGPPQHYWWAQIILITWKKKLLNFDCPWLSLEGDRLRMCSHAQLLVGNVASPPLGCGYFFLKFFVI
jgi:hypothetical protein